MGRCSQCHGLIYPHTDWGHHPDLGRLCETCMTMVETEEDAETMRRDWEHEIYQQCDEEDRKEEDNYG